MSIRLVTTKQVCDHLHIETSQRELLDDLDLKILAVSAVIMRHIKLTDYDEDWYDDSSPAVLTIPYDIRAAALLAVGEMYMTREASTANVLSPTVLDLLRSYRDPSMA